MNTSAINLSVNVNKVALLRNSRGGDYPSVVDYSNRCLEYGAKGITVHPRSDCRHIKPADVIALSTLIQQWKQRDPNVEFNIEGNPFAKANNQYPGLTTLVEQCQPDQVTLVPDTESQLTSDSGFDLSAQNQIQTLKLIVSHYQRQGSRVSLFMDANPSQIKLVSATGADRVELYTGPYAADPNNAELFELYQATAAKASKLKIGLNGGHDLNLDNIAKFSTVGSLLEVSIGHALIVESLEFGLRQVIERYTQILSTN